MPLNLSSTISDPTGPSSPSLSNSQWPGIMENIAFEAEWSIKEISELLSPVQDRILEKETTFGNATSWMNYLEDVPQCIALPPVDFGKYETYNIEANSLDDIYISSQKRRFHEEDSVDEKAAQDSTVSIENSATAKIENRRNLRPNENINENSQTNEPHFGEQDWEGSHRDCRSNDSTQASNAGSSTGKAAMKDGPSILVQHTLKVAGKSELSMMTPKQGYSTTANSNQEWDLSFRLPKKKRRVNWNHEDNSQFISIVEEYNHTGERELRQLLARKFRGRRTREQCVNHLRILRAQGKVPKQQKEADSLKQN